MDTMQSLRGAMINLKLEDKDRSDQERGQLMLYPVDIKIPSMPARLPPLPSDYQTHERHYTLGWRITNNWMRNFGIQASSRDVAMRTSNLFLLGLKQLKWWSGYKHLCSFTTLADGAPIPPRSTTGEDAPSQTQRIIAVTFSATRELLKRRPTQAQYDWFVQLFEEEPIWYRDLLPKDRWYLHDIE
ncbi:hypothetical protein SCP_1303290 [Sparassis crispa]|uniref:Uncharacterized protein n=1 Tax=Sparassis crispa TaxID=139825 RepID=A0A401H296_9APHY|nr:hypothetical protein SCP_1303290 [Sparassis crispa]GBE88513.1 hypothetical protein SCP_1303290 [Sparassis crispa]